VWLPVLRPDPENDRRKKASWTTFTVNPTGATFFTPLEMIDRQIQARHFGPDVDVSKLRSSFSPSVKYVFAAIPRTWDPDGKGLRVVLVEVGWDVARQMNDLHDASDPVNAAMLKDGPITFYDLVIGVVENPKWRPGMDERNRRKYTVAPYKNQFVGKLPKEFSSDGVPKDFDLVANGVFTEEEVSVIQETEIDLKATLRPATSDEIEFGLQKTPLNLYAKRRGDVPVFTHPYELAGRLSEYRLLVYSEEQVTAQLAGVADAVDGDPGTRSPTHKEASADPPQDAEEVPSGEPAKAHEQAPPSQGKPPAVPVGPDPARKVKF
jgi:hypothetical protein